MGFGRSNKRSSPAPAPVAASRPAMAPPPAARPMTTAAPPVAAAPQGPSMMGMMGSSMAGSMAGSMIGNAVSNSWGSSAPAAGQAPAPAGTAPMMPAGPTCSFETQQFVQCMSQTADNMDYCRGVFDQFKLCQTQAMSQAPMQ